MKFSENLSVVRMVALYLVMVDIAIADLDEILINVRYEEGWDEEVTFWGNVACHAGRKRIFSVHEIPQSDPSRRLNDFFGELITNVQSECGATTRTKSYGNIDHNDDQSYWSLFGGGDHEELLKNGSVLIETPDNATFATLPTHLFPHSDVEVLLVLLDDAIRVLTNSKVFEKWDNRRHVIVLMLTKKKTDSHTSKLLADTFITMLQNLWNENRVLNVFFAAPFSTMGHLLWFYDPFIKNLVTGKRGQIFARQISRIANLDRVSNLHGYELNIGMFEATPTAIKYDPVGSYSLPFAKQSQGFVGMDGLTLEAVAKHMNFTFRIIPPTDGIEFGWVHPNGTFLGTIGDAAYHRIDIGFNSMYLKIYSQDSKCVKAIEFTIPIDFDRLCIIVPRAGKIPRWLRTFYYFHPAIWVCLVMTHVIVALVWYLIRNFRAGPEVMKGRAPGYSALLLATFFLFIGAPVNIKPGQIERILLVAFLILGVTVMGTFTGTLYHSFTTEMYYEDIANLKILDESNLAIGTASPNLKDVFGLNETADEPPEIKRLRKKMKVMRSERTSTIEKTAYQRNVASLSRGHSFSVSKYRYVDETGASLIHLVPECPRAYYLSYVMPRKSFYMKRINRILRRLDQAGLPQLWNEVTTDRLINIVTSTTNTTATNDGQVPFNLKDLQTAFMLLILGHTIAIFIFAGEMLYAKKLGHCENKSQARLNVRFRAMDHALRALRTFENGRSQIRAERTSGLEFKTTR